MKKNGFMVVECIIASVIVLTAITVLYTQIKGVTRTYNTSFNYDNITSMYSLANFRTFLMNDDNFDKLVTELNNNYSCDETDCSKCYIYVDCSKFTNGNINYCDALLTNMGITTSTAHKRQIIFVKENLSNLKTCLNSDIRDLNISLADYIKTIKSETSDKRYMLIALFDDNTTASLVLYRASGV